ncbi:translation initiation factor IF-2-like [Rissa tridactyla]|uniref:translation initiation factor IF-2-like n=1 Tax=Rissa tridactyla TaxID=75485 RepID=UPI0023BA56A0|nr:translation initiation factor IF-2-like [Rissa tridactyla]
MTLPIWSAPPAGLGSRGGSRRPAAPGRVTQPGSCPRGCAAASGSSAGSAASPCGAGRPPRRRRRAAAAGPATRCYPAAPPAPAARPPEQLPVVAEEPLQPGPQAPRLRPHPLGRQRLSRPLPAAGDPQPRRGAPHHGDTIVAGPLEAEEPHDRQQVPNVQRVGGGVEAAVGREGRVSRLQQPLLRAGNTSWKRPHSHCTASRPPVLPAHRGGCCWWAHRRRGSRSSSGARSRWPHRKAASVPTPPSCHGGGWEQGEAPRAYV